jgi:hypothetical protein
MGSAAPGDIDESGATAGRAARAVAVAGAWAIAALPLALGWQHCPVAMIFHRPCPGCGITRAIELLVGGHVSASIRMHPLAVPALAALALLASSTIRATLETGSPALFHRDPLGRVALAALAVFYVGALVVWGLRSFGYLGGPVSVG